MILVDANLLLYAQVETFEQHTAARRWLDDRLNGVERVGLPWPSLLAFVRIVSNPRVFESPLAVREAWDHVGRWLDCESAWIPAPTDRHREVLGRLLNDHAMPAEMIPDAHLAALALEHGLVVCSSDLGFGRFPEVRWKNPLA